MLDQNELPGEHMRYCEWCGVGLGIMSLREYERRYKENGEACPVCGKTMNSNNDEEGVSKNQTNIYFIQSGDDGPIKIGQAQDVFRRLSGLQVASPETLKVIGVIEGVSPKHEKRLHRRFAKYRIRGEWFQPNAEIRNFIRHNSKLFNVGGEW